MSEYSLGEERDALLDQVDRLEAKVRELEQALRAIGKSLDVIHLKCQCYQWLGGCKRETQCNLGYLRDAKDAIKTALHVTDKAAQK